MRLDVMNRRLGVKIPSEVFKSCPRCRKEELLIFEGEVFCLSCNWDSVELHAEALALAQLYRQQKKAVAAPVRSLPRLAAAIISDLPALSTQHLCRKPRGWSMPGCRLNETSGGEKSMNSKSSKMSLLKKLRSRWASLAEYWHEQAVRGAEIERLRAQQQERFQDRLVRVGARYWIH